MAKIIDKIESKINIGEHYFSLEFFPPKSEEAVPAQEEKQKKLALLHPLFSDLTWGAGGSNAGLALDISKKMQQQLGYETMLHMTCTNIHKDSVLDALHQCQKNGLKNILALRGDPPRGQDKWEAVEGGLTNALDMIKFIKLNFGDYFGIGVAGYPEGHPDTIIEGDEKKTKENYWGDIKYLKQKIDAGGQFVITQLFFDPDLFVQYVKDCRSVGINCPIIPGIMPIFSYNAFNRMAELCKVGVPKSLKEKTDSLKNDPAGLKKFGTEYAIHMSKVCLESGASMGVHIYTINQDEQAAQIVKGLQFVDNETYARAGFVN